MRYYLLIVLLLLAVTSNASIINGTVTDKTPTQVTLKAEYVQVDVSTGAIDTVWFFYDDDTTIADATGAEVTSDVTTPTDTTITGLTALKYMNFWVVVSHGVADRDTSERFNMSPLKNDFRYELYNQLHMDTAGTNQVDAGAVDTIIDMGYNVIAKTFWSYVNDTTIALVGGQSEYAVPSDILEIPFGESILWSLYTQVNPRGDISPVGVRAVPGDSIYAVVQEHQALTEEEDGFSYIFLANNKFWLYPTPKVEGSAESLKVCYRSLGGSAIPPAYRSALFTWCCWQIQAKRFGLESIQAIAWQARWERLKAEGR